MAERREEFPRGRVIGAAIYMAVSDLFSAWGVASTALLFAFGDAVWPPSTKAHVGARIDHAVGVVIIVFVGLWLLAFTLRLLVHRRRRTRRWGVDAEPRAEAGPIDVSLTSRQPLPVSILHGAFEGRVRRPNGHIHVSGRASGVDAGRVGGSADTLDVTSLTLPGPCGPGEYEIRWYRPMLLSWYGEITRHKFTVPAS